MWRLLLGTLLAALPRRWRAAARAEQAIPWGRAAALSGLGESLLAFAGLVAWYSHSVTTWAGNAFDSALRNGPEAEVPGQAIGFSALLLWCLHPWTWLIAFFAVEGLVRMLAAVAGDEVRGLSVLALADWCWGKATGREREGDALHVPGGRQQVESFIAAAKEKVQSAALADLPDEIAGSGADALFLEIRSCQPKNGWIPPRVVRVGRAYYRLEAVSEGSRPRPFVFHLRRLEAGVPGRAVLVYEGPEEDPR